ncbi:MAG: amino acid ABC transporter permease [Janthinobacterium lividum]
MSISLPLIWSYVLSAPFYHAALMTLAISVASLFWGMVVGLLLALLQEARWRVLRLLAVGYLWLFRGTPVLFQLIFVFNVLPGFGIVLSGFTCAVLALALNEGAYMAEIMRSGIRAVGRGQRLAARALGMPDWQVMRWVVLPQALRIVIPPIGNQFIGMLKLSALVSVIAVQELLLVANQTASANFRYVEALSAAGIYYLAMTTLLMLGQFLLEHALRRRGRGRTPRGTVSATLPATLPGLADAARTR